MNRNDLKVLARIRIRDAHVLLSAGNYEGAYYLCGYAIECGLKACIARKTKAHDFPDKDMVSASYTHNLHQLVKTAGLELILKRAIQKDKHFEKSWAVVKDWTEKSRYEKTSNKKAKDLYLAVTNKRSGVMKWIEKYW
jgi:hypothetical protein